MCRTIRWLMLFLGCGVPALALADCPFPAAGWFDLPPIPDSELWRFNEQDLTAIHVSRQPNTHSILHVGQFLRNSFNGQIRFHVFSLNLDDAYRRWQRLQTPSGPAYNGSWPYGHVFYAASTNNFVLMDREGVIWHYMGEAWSVGVDLGEPGYLFGFAPDEMFAIGRTNAYYFDGGDWSELPASFPTHGGGDFDMWRNSTDDYFVVGGFGFFARIYNGVVTVIPTGTTKQLSAVWGNNPNDMYLAEVYGTDDPRILFYDGFSVTTAWQEGIPNGRFHHLMGFEVGTVFAVGDGAGEGRILSGQRTNWVCGTVDRSIRAVASDHRDHFVVAGDDLLLMHYGPVTLLPPHVDLVKGSFPGVLQYHFQSSLRPAAMTYSFEFTQTPQITDSWQTVTSANIYQSGDYHVVYSSAFLHLPFGFFRVIEQPE